MMQERAIVLRHIGWSRLLGSASGLLIGLALVLLAAAPLASAQAIVEFTVPGAGSQPTGITTGPDGNLWFTEFGSSEIGRITPAGLVEEFVLPAGRGPDSIVSGPDGLLWFTERSGDRIGRINPNAGNHAAIQASIVEFTVPGAGSQPTGITTGPDGNLWFTEFGSSEIGRITTGAPTATPTVTATSSPTPTPTTTPTCILGDINCDRIVDIRDYGIWRQNFGQGNCGNAADLNRDCLVDIRDYGIWRQHFGAVAPGDHRMGGAQSIGMAAAPGGTPGPAQLRGDQPTERSRTVLQAEGRGGAVPVIPLLGGLLGLGGLAGRRARRPSARE